MLFMFAEIRVLNGKVKRGKKKKIFLIYLIYLQEILTL